MTRAKLRCGDYCEYCTEVMKHCDQYWKENCLETDRQILCSCPYLNNLKKYIFNSYNIKTEKLFNKDIKDTTYRTINFFEKTKLFNRTPKINKRDLSPNRIIK